MASTLVRVLIFQGQSAVIPKQGCGKGEGGYNQQTADAGAHGVSCWGGRGMSGCHSYKLFAPKIGDRTEMGTGNDEQGMMNVEC